MSWDIIVFNTRQNIEHLEEIDSEQLIPLAFDELFQKNLKVKILDSETREIIGNDFSVSYTISEKAEGHQMLHLYGEKAIYTIIDLAKKHHLQIFDTMLGEMIDLVNPSKNGYTNFEAYIKQLKAAK